MYREKWENEGEAMGKRQSMGNHKSIASGGVKRHQIIQYTEKFIKLFGRKSSFTAIKKWDAMDFSFFID